MKVRIRDCLLSTPLIGDWIIHFKSLRTVKEYRKWRDFYHAEARQQGLIYSPEALSEKVQNHLAKRRYTPPVKDVGDIHTFVAVPRWGWHHQLYGGFRHLGPVSEYDYIGHGFNSREFRSAGREGRERRDEMNNELLQAVRSAHQGRRIDWFFCYAQAFEISPNTIDRIQREFGFPVVNMCLDDKQSWDSPWIGGQSAGQRLLAPVVDLAWTSSRVACEWYLALGGRPIFLAEGCSIDGDSPAEVDKDIDVSFIGAKYGFREKTIEFLKKNGVNVAVYGAGWKSGPISDQEALNIISRSRINLGMGGIDYSEWLTNVKGRDFDIPSLGMGVYLTSFNPDLACYFHIGREILCYRTKDEMLELIRYYLNHPEEGRIISATGRERCRREHQWYHRYLQICQTLGILDRNRGLERRIQ